MGKANHIRTFANGEMITQITRKGFCVHSSYRIAHMKRIATNDGDKTVGVARLVWDGGYAALIKDVDLALTE